MEIGIDASRAGSRQRTGTESYAFFLIQALIELCAQQNHRLRLYFNRPPADGLFPSAPHLELVILPFPRLWTHLRLAAHLQRKPPDIFFTPAHVIPFSYRGRSVATVHDLGYHYFPEAHTRGQNLYLRWSTRHNSRRSRQVLADSQATRDDLQRFYGTDGSKVAVVYSGIDPMLQPVTDEAGLAAAQARYGIQAPYFLYLGTLQPRKNLARLVDAFTRLEDERHQLVLAGGAGWLARPLLEKINALPEKLRQRIILPGFVAETDKAALLSGATALVYPSLYEGFGFPVLEAQQCGTAVICADNSSLPEVAGDSALLVTAEDVEELSAAMARLIDDQDLRRQLVEQGRQNVARFDWARAARQTLAVLEQAAA